MFASLTPAGLGGLGRSFALKHLHTSFFVAAHYQTTVLVGLKRLDVKLDMVWALASKCSSWLFNQYALLWGFRSMSCRIRQMLERLMASVWRASSKVATISSKVQRVTVRS